MKRRLWKKIDEQETLQRLKIKRQAEKLKKVNKIEGCEIRIKLIKDTTNSDTEELRIERVNKLIM